ncbi:MAG: quinolinate synthase NadA, partial [Candidatus Altiarchaeales archaeon]|nr:quinolinate synthase NadA [Candidatus Altiarchaeales archaeon]
LCPTMKTITLEKVLASLKEKKHEVVVPNEIARKARKALDRMLELI